MRGLARLTLVAFLVTVSANAQELPKLQGFDAYMQKLLKDWNAPGIGVGIVVKDQLVFAKGYGYRDYAKKLPITRTTLFPIASNTKLFTAVSAGMLVEQGKLTWDSPIRQSVPALRFYNDQLNDNVTLHDMLSHRTGITRHDLMWYKSPFTRKELFERVKYLEPQQPMRTTFLYNNLMYMAAGYSIELVSGSTWEQFVHDHILAPLDMNATVYTIADMERSPDHGVPFDERRDSFELYQIPYYEDQAGIAPAGAIISNIDDLSHWLIALMNDGQYHGKQVLPANVLKATMQPSIGLPNAAGESFGYWELLNSAYGMGRDVAAYRGHLLTFHGGDIDGFHSQISFMPNDHIGVIVFAIGDHAAPLYNVVMYNVYERLLGMDQTPWSERRLQQRLADKKAGTAGRAQAGADRVPDTKPSHALADYVGTYDNPGYGEVHIGLTNDTLRFTFHEFSFPLFHFHYDRFDTPDDERYGRFSINFRTNPQGDIDNAVMSLDEGQVAFARKPEMPDSTTLAKLAGTYLSPDKSTFQVNYIPGGGLAITAPGAPPLTLVPLKGLRFRDPHIADETYEFVMDNGRVKEIKDRTPEAVYTYPRQ